MHGLMEDPPGAARPRRVSFKSEYLSPAKTGKSSGAWHAEHQRLMSKEMLPSCSSCRRYAGCLEMESPLYDMEFLCRPWSASASNLLLIFCNRLCLPSHFNQSSKDLHEAKQEVSHSQEEGDDGQEMLEAKSYARDCINGKIDCTWFTTERCGPSLIPKTLSINKRLMKGLKNMKARLKSNSLPGLLRRHSEKRKEDARFHTANIHAALSVARLAAAIAGFAASSSTEAVKDVNAITCGGRVPWEKNTGVIVASAAALVATACAEAAESAGAQTAHVASALNSGLACQSPADIITLMAAAATCLRGAATLKSRTVTSPSIPRIQEPLNARILLTIVTPSGQRRQRWLSFYLKQRKLMLKLDRKCLGFTLPASQENEILDVSEEIEEVRDTYSIILKTNKGDIKLLFQDKNQPLLWISFVSNILQTYCSC